MAETVISMQQASPSGSEVAGADPKQYLFYTLPLGAYSSMVLTSGLTMAAADVLYVDASTTNVAFQLSGVEIT